MTEYFLLLESRVTGFFFIIGVEGDRVLLFVLELGVYASYPSLE